MNHERTTMLPLIDLAVGDRKMLMEISVRPRKNIPTIRTQAASVGEKPSHGITVFGNSRSGTPSRNVYAATYNCHRPAVGMRLDSGDIVDMISSHSEDHLHIGRIECLEIDRHLDEL